MENNPLKIALVAVLDKFIQVCEANNLRYYMAYGSALGAIRHKGIIPWDDDIDVQMPREDYEKIQLLPKSVWGDMELTSWKIKSGNHYPFLKLENTHTTIIEQLYPLYVGGIYIDIFPIDNAPNDMDVFNQQITDVCNILDKYYTISVRTGSQYKGLVNYLKFKFRHFIYMHQHIQDEWEKIALRENDNTNNVFTYYITDGYHGEKPLPSEWFGEGITCMFEGRNVIIPQNWDSYLKQFYGDYMIPPPMDKRTGYAFVYVNLEERVKGEELDKIVQEIKMKTSFKFSVKDEMTYWKAKLHL